MKPKKKSNVIFLALLFLFTPFFAEAYHSWPTPDTIIIDGEIIYIEPEVIYTNVDSLNTEAKHDVKLKKIPQHIWTAGLYAGLSTTIGKFRTGEGELQTLDEFIDNPKSVMSDFSAAGNIGVRVWRIPAGQGFLDVSFVTGAGLNKTRISSTSINDESPFAQDSIFQLRYAEGALLLDYFNIFNPLDGPPYFGEVDTATIELSKRVTSFTTIDIPFSIRIAWSNPKSALRVFAEAGAVKQVILGSVDAHDNFLVNAEGDFAALRKAEFQTLKLIRPVFSLGVERKIEPKNEVKGKFLAWGSQVTAILPAGAINSGSLFVMDAKSITFSMFLRGYF